MTSIEELKHIAATADLLHSETAVEAAIDRMAQQINVLLADLNPLVLCVMNGGVVIAGKILTRLTMPLTIDAINASRYNNTTSGSTLKWIQKPQASLQNRTVLIVDDILDAGITLKAIYDYCLEQGATAVYTAVLLEKLLEHRKPIKADFVGLEVENRYLFGYGLDYKGYWRNAAGIFACRESSQ
ncbi:MAG: hypoxanthine-guanine phosphoribosyltransferase [Methylococcaceae bacterium]|nr:hypoxanthine-guanine phosphoribosyltransferase [Methylococcaceae bacterium]